MKIDSGSASIKSQLHNYVAENQISSEKSGGDLGQPRYVAFNLKVCLPLAV